MAGLFNMVSASDERGHCRQSQHPSLTRQRADQKQHKQQSGRASASVAHKVDGWVGAPPSEVGLLTSACRVEMHGRPHQTTRKIARMEARLSSQRNGGYILSLRVYVSFCLPDLSPTLDSAVGTRQKDVLRERAKPAATLFPFHAPDSPEPKNSPERKCCCPSPPNAYFGWAFLRKILEFSTRSGVSQPRHL